MKNPLWMFLINIVQNNQKRKRKDISSMTKSVDLWLSRIVQISILFVSKPYVFMRS